MIKSVIGLDTSNYRSSVAVVALNGEILLNRRELLSVPTGKRGLRQNDAVYAQIKAMKRILPEVNEICGKASFCAVCASTTPRGHSDSYMPVFEVGDTIGRALASVMDLPFFQTDHQCGHIRAAQIGTALEGEKHFIAIHLSGGTTDLLSVNQDTILTLGHSLDIHAGQLVDRVGVMLGLPFPSGPDLEKLAASGHCSSLLGCSMEDDDLSCHFSGAEAQCQRWIKQQSLAPDDIALEVFDLLARTVSRMLISGSRHTGMNQSLICGGVASSALFRTMLLDRLGRRRRDLKICFGQPELSGDNAVGVALIGAERYRRYHVGSYS